MIVGALAFLARVGTSRLKLPLDNLVSLSSSILILTYGSISPSSPSRKSDLKSYIVLPRALLGGSLQIVYKYLYITNGKVPSY